MGTRHMIAVQVDGEYKVAQYGQWDGYPEGQGVDILNILHNVKLGKLKNQVQKCSFMSDDDYYKTWDEFDVNIRESGLVDCKIGDEYNKKYPQFDRSIGAKILSYIYNNDYVFLRNSIDFAKDGLFCVYAYVIDFDKNTFEVYTGREEKPSDNERFYDGEDPVNGYYPVTKIAQFDLDNLPTEDEFLKELSSF